MPSNLIAIEKDRGARHPAFERIMRMIPDKEKTDERLQRLIAFRLRTNGEEETKLFVMHKIREIIRCRYRGPLFDYLRNDEQMNACRLR